VKVETAKIPDFAPLIKDDIKNQITSYHSMVHTNPFTGREHFFLSNPNHEILENDPPITLPNLIAFAEKNSGYRHKWEKGDLLIWDNVQVMHRSAGAFEGRRLLFRVQARLKYAVKGDPNLLAEAVKIASRNVKCGGGPFGAIIVDKTGKVIARAANSVTKNLDPTAHAEVCAIREAC
jgi:hypothetical protein